MSEDNVNKAAKILILRQTQKIGVVQPAQTEVQVNIQ